MDLNWTFTSYVWSIRTNGNQLHMRSFVGMHSTMLIPPVCVMQLETGGMPPVTKTNDYNASPLEVAGCASTNQQNLPPTKKLVMMYGLRDSLKHD